MGRTNISFCCEEVLENVCADGPLPLHPWRREYAGPADTAVDGGVGRAMLLTWVSLICPLMVAEH